MRLALGTGICAFLLGCAAARPAEPQPITVAPTSDPFDLCDAARYLRFQSPRSTRVIAHGAAPRVVLGLVPSGAHRVRIAVESDDYRSMIAVAFEPARSLAPHTLCFPFAVADQTYVNDASKVSGTLAVARDGVHVAAATSEESRSIPSYALRTHVADVLDDAALAFPPEAVGVGATWEATETLTINTFRIERRVRSKLVALEANGGATLDVAIEQRVPPQKWMGANADPDREALVSRDETAHGTLRLVPGAPLLEGRMEWQSRARLEEPGKVEVLSTTHAIVYAVD